MRIVRAIAATVLAAAFMSASSVAGASPPSVAPALRQQVYSWEWADGSVAKERTFRSSKYANRVKQIAVLVQVRPAKPRHTVKIEVYQQGKWQTHVRTKTSARTGRARLQINPICSSGNWCKGTFNLRLRVLRKGGQNPATQGLKVTFDPGSSSSPVVPPPSKPKIPCHPVRADHVPGRGERDAGPTEHHSTRRRCRTRTSTARSSST